VRNVGGGITLSQNFFWIFAAQNTYLDVSSGLLSAKLLLLLLIIMFSNKKYYAV